MQVISFVGYQGSGKSLLGRKLARILHTDHVEISDIVKREYEGLSRSELPSTAARTKEDPTWLGRLVQKEAERIFAEQERDVAIISGVREAQIHDWLVSEAIYVWPIEVHTPAAVRYLRLLDLGKIKTARAFLEQDLLEKYMGLDVVLAKALAVVKTSEYTNPNTLVDSVKRHLEKKGAKWS